MIRGGYYSEEDALNGIDILIDCELDRRLSYKYTDPKAYERFINRLTARLNLYRERGKSAEW